MKINTPKRVAEAKEMQEWLLKNRIVFESTFKNDFVFIKLIDKKHNCVLIVEDYQILVSTRDYRRGDMKYFRKIITKFEEEEVYPILFDWDDQEKDRMSLERLIRED